MRQIGLILITFAFIGCSSSPNVSSVTAITQSNSVVVTDLMHELEREHIAGTFDGMVLVVHERETLLEAAFGFADRQQMRKNDADVVYDMGSIAKTFTAAAVLQLAANNKIELTQTLVEFYPSNSNPFSIASV